MSLDPTLSARLVRAAWAYSLLDQDELAERSGLHKDTLRRLLARTKPTAATLDQRYAIADACQVPRYFMDEGFPTPEQDIIQELLQRMDFLEEMVHRLDGARQNVTEEMVQLSRRTKQALAGPPADDAQGTAAETGTRDASGATEGSPQAPAVGTRRSAGRPGR